MKKIHKLDLIFIVGIGFIAILSALIDANQKTNFPVYSCMSIYVSYALWIILVIYSFFKYKEKEGTPQCVKWFMCFVLPFLHIFFIMIGFIICNLIINLLNL